MLVSRPLSLLSELDETVFDAIVPAEHYLRKVNALIDFERTRPVLADAYCQELGRPAIDPVRMLKIAFLSFHYRLSDRQVTERIKTDMAFRWFLRLSMDEAVPNHTNGTRFRNRIGAKRFEDVFQGVVRQARELGLVSDRRRLKDATHIYGDVADVQPLALAVHVRERLLGAAVPFFAEWVKEQRVQIETLRQATAELPDDERLAARVEQLREMAGQLQDRVASLPASPASPASADDAKRTRLDKALALTAKLLADRDSPRAPDRLASAVDPDARVGKHGEYFVGYLLDMAIDAESEIITAVNVLPANGAEAADAVELIEQEERAQGNDVEGISIDGAGYNGPVLRELTDPEGLNLDVIVPPPTPVDRKTFGPERFALTVLDEGKAEATCPNGERTRQRERNGKDTGWKYVFKPSQCNRCPLREECLQNPESQGGRTVIKNDYEAEYKRVEEQAKTEEYQEARRAHPRIERKLNDVTRHHGARRARYRGIGKVLAQAFLTTLAVNVKRMVKVVAEKLTSAPALPERAELAIE